MSWARRLTFRMSTIDDIKNAIQRLSREELATFRAWFVEYDARIWDEQIAHDAIAGKLDSLADEANQLVRDGRVLDL